MESINPNILMSQEGEETGGCPVWLVTFGDTMSLLLTFFVLLLSFSSFDDVRVTQAMKAIDEHLGGGVVTGDALLKANYKFAREEIELINSMTNKVIRPPVDVLPRELFHLDAKREEIEKVEWLKNMLRNSPTMLSILLEGPKRKPDVAEQSSKILNRNVAELSLFNLKLFLKEEHIAKKINIVQDEEGNITFEINRGLLFDENQSHLKLEGRELLKRIIVVMKKMPNYIAMNMYPIEKQKKKYSGDAQKALSLERTIEIMNYCVHSEKQIEKNRFCIQLVSLDDKIRERLQRIDELHDGVIGITLLSPLKDDVILSGE